VLAQYHRRSASKINKRSIIVYDKAKNYRLFEFVWNHPRIWANV